MSRIGKQPILLPEKVDIKIDGGSIKIKGPKGELHKSFSCLVKVELKDKAVNVKPLNDSRESRGLWGVTRTMISNMVTGVSVGFKKSLEFNGVGYKAAVSGSTLNLSLGFSHQIDHKLPLGVKAIINKNIIELEGADKELIGQIAATIRSYRPPEPYKGKGLKYLDEKIKRKAGKTGAKK